MTKLQTFSNSYQKKEEEDEVLYSIFIHFRNKNYGNTMFFIYFNQLPVIAPCINSNDFPPPGPQNSLIFSGSTDSLWPISGTPRLTMKKNYKMLFFRVWLALPPPLSGSSGLPSEDEFLEWKETMLLPFICRRPPTRIPNIFSKFTLAFGHLGSPSSKASSI